MRPTSRRSHPPRRGWCWLSRKPTPSSSATPCSKARPRPRTCSPVTTGDAPAAPFDVSAPAAVVRPAARRVPWASSPSYSTRLPLRATTKVEPRDEAAAVEDLDLRFEGREAGVDGAQPGATLHRRLRASIGQRDELAGLNDAAVARRTVPTARPDRARSTDRQPDERVQRGQRVRAAEQPGEVHSRADRRCDAETAELARRPPRLSGRCGRPCRPPRGRRPGRPHQVDRRHRSVGAHRRAPRHPRARPRSAGRRRRPGVRPAPARGPGGARRRDRPRPRRRRAAGDGPAEASAGLAGLRRVSPTVACHRGA